MIYSLSAENVSILATTSYLPMNFQGGKTFNSSLMQGGQCHWAYTMDWGIHLVHLIHLMQGGHR